MERNSEKDPLGYDAHTPGAKLDAGKLRFNLVLKDFARAFQEVVKVGTMGSIKYSDSGWLQVPNGQSRYADAQGRHQNSRHRGEEYDPQSGLLHQAHEAWNVLAQLELKLRELEKASTQDIADPGEAPQAFLIPIGAIDPNGVSGRNK
jgi:hypothetical protein